MKLTSAKAQTLTGQRRCVNANKLDTGIATTEKKCSFLRLQGVSQTLRGFSETFLTYQSPKLIQSSTVTLFPILFFEYNRHCSFREREPQ